MCRVATSSMNDSICRHCDETCKSTGRRGTGYPQFAFHRLLYGVTALPPPPPPPTPCNPPPPLAVPPPQGDEGREAGAAGAKWRVHT